MASFLGWWAGQGVEWSSIGLAELARFKHFAGATPGRGGRLRSGATVHAALTAVCEFLRFCARAGLIEAVVVGDRGMITSARIAALNQADDGASTPAPYRWITALRAPLLRS